ncbi:hypothetical protein K435DRAFT_833419 [Dendrothele bispora CBS 962.96]|uniref:Homeobox KN domain-containing protein n=1 Tax=Dendrothele bispora (strain CBS 962.96) TaxID=1314807 RepID=A0A4S8MWJ8_DENBC|nr:hypothetical protein K435DRAFT_833419 [Dendrothele bispora CBS 962.96]
MNTISPTAIDFQSRLISSFDQVLAVEDSSRSQFSSQWQQLCSEIKACPTDSLSEDTKQLAYATAMGMETLCQLFLELEILSDGIKPRFSHPSAPETIHVQHGEDSPKRPARYVKSAHCWLLDNLHNPYPSTSLREDIGASVGSSRKSMDNWFIDARKYIGWNLLRQKFKTRKQMIAEATTYFKPSDGVSPSSEYDAEFRSIAERAKSMFDDESEDPCLKTVSGSRESGSEDESDVPMYKPQVVVQATEIIAEERQKRPVSTISPSALAGHKRRVSEISDIFAPTSSVKRSRTDNDELSRAPASISPTSLNVVKEAGPSLLSSPSAPASTSFPINRKRRLSESDVQSAPKRPRHQVISQPGRSVSEPLVSLNNLENWFTTAFTPESTPGLDISSGELVVPDYDDSSSNSGLTTPETYQIPFTRQDDEVSTPYDCSSPSNSSVASDFDNLLNGFDTDSVLSSGVSMDSLGLGLSADFGSANFSQPQIVDSSQSNSEYWLPNPSEYVLEGDLPPLTLDGGFEVEKASGFGLLQQLSGKTVSLSNIDLPSIQF